MRVFTASLATESNSFSPIPTSLESYKESFYMPPGRHPDYPKPTTAPLFVLREVGKARGWTVIEGTCALTEPAGPTTRVAYETLRDEILGQLTEAMPVDAVILGLHGAMIADGYDDCEGDILARVRAIVGPKVTIGAELDPHCHLTAAMTGSADVLICYKEFPHTDFVERGRELVDLVAACVEGRIKPVMSVFDCRMIASFPTSRQPMRGFVDKIKTMEGKDGVLSISVVHCFPYGDVADIGAKILVVTDADKSKGDGLARALGHELYAMRGNTMPRFLTIDEALDYALARDGGPFVIADPADNAGGGAPSDNTSILRRLIERNVRGAAIGPIWDPQAVRFCFRAGAGARLNLRMGGKTGRFSGPPVDAEVEIIATTKDATQRFAGQSVVQLGDAAGVRVGGVEVMLNTLRTQARSPDLFSAVGIDALAKKVVVVKSTNHFYAAFAPVAKEVLYVDSDGLLLRDHRKVPYTKLTRPIWPFDADPLDLGTAPAQQSRAMSAD